MAKVRQERDDGVDRRERDGRRPAELAEWDDGEIMRSQRRDRTGRFRGRPPLVVPQAVYQERIKRLMSEAGRLLEESTSMP